MPSRSQEVHPSAVPSGLADVLAQTAFATMAGLTKIASDNDLSLTQLRVLAILRDRRLRMTDLVGYLGLEKSTLTGLIARAEARGLVLRSPDPDDKRAVYVTLSDDGRALATHLADDLSNQLEPAMSSLSTGEQAALRDLLAKTLA